ncbi:hypothetical protein LPJ72_005855, partial [Coemansia sp. Benny D160-2]
MNNSQNNNAGAVADISEAADSKPHNYSSGVDIDERDRDLLQRQNELEELDSDTKTNWEMIKKLTVCG